MWRRRSPILARWDGGEERKGGNLSPGLRAPSLPGTRFVPLLLLWPSLPRLSLLLLLAMLSPALLPLLALMTPLLLLPASLGFLRVCAPRARAHSISLILLLVLVLQMLLPPLLPLLLLLLYIDTLVVPELAVPPPSREALGVPTPRGVFLDAVQVPAEGVVPDGGADVPLLPRQSVHPLFLVSWALHLGPCLIL